MSDIQNRWHQPTLIVGGDIDKNPDDCRHGLVLISFQLKLECH